MNKRLNRRGRFYIRGLMIGALRVLLLTDLCINSFLTYNGHCKVGENPTIKGGIRSRGESIG